MPIPSTWVKQNTDANTSNITYALNMQDQNTGDGVQVIIVDRQGEDVSTSQYMEMIIDGFEQQYPQVGIQVEFSDLYEDAELGVHTGTGALAELTGSDDTHLAQMLFVYLVDDHLVYINVLASSPDTLDEIASSITGA